MPIRPAWREWFEIFERSLETLDLSSIDLHGINDADRKSAALTLFGRLRSEMRSALILVDAGRDMAFRSYCRSAMECSLAEADSTYMARLHTDDTVSRKARAKKYLSSRTGHIGKEVAKSLQKFIDDSAGIKGKLNVSELQTAFPWMPHVYREISADTAHVSWTALMRHADQSDPLWARMVVEPKMSDEEMEEAASIVRVFRPGRP